MYLSLVVPCYNEEQNVRPFYDKVIEELGAFADDMEIVFVNDGSRDHTMRELQALLPEAKCKMRVVQFSRNFGKEAALLAGLSHATGEFTAIIDADLQQNPSYVKEMLKILKDHPEYDSVAAYQAHRNEGKILSFFKDCFYKLINRITDVEFFRSASDFRLLRRKVVDAILALPEKCRFSKGIFSWVGFETYYMPYDVEERMSGTSKWNFWKLSSYAINGIVAFSDKPLIISSVVGLGLFGASVIMGLIILIKTILFGDPVAGFPTLACLLLFLSGIQLLCLGIMGQYLAKIYTESKERPVYVVRDVLENQESADEEI